MRPAAEARPELTVVPSVPSDSLEAEITRAASHSFDLTAEIPLRAWLFETGEREQVLLLLVHHIAGDGWSVPLLPVI
ncbi:Amino acid adenylation domain-containing protein OS=Streptomyces tendae OX=1932 GN=GUR47_35325 PE=4 SV=1 [Streptomyces tendae]